MLELVTFPTHEDKIFNLLFFFSPYFAILRVHLARSSSDQAVIQNYNQAKPLWTPEETERLGDCKLDRLHIPAQTLSGLSVLPRKANHNMDWASSINSYHQFTLIITEEEEIQTETL